jgi:hypothetical protein
MREDSAGPHLTVLGDHLDFDESLEQQTDPNASHKSHMKKHCRSELTAYGHKIDRIKGLDDKGFHTLTFFVGATLTLKTFTPSKTQSMSDVQKIPRLLNITRWHVFFEN